MGFDVAEEQFRRYAPAAYRKAIHFSVPRRLVSGSFLETYGISARGVLGPARAAVASYRRSARSLLPAFLNAERVILRSRLPDLREAPRRNNCYEISRRPSTRPNGQAHTGSRALWRIFYRS